MADEAAQIRADIAEMKRIVKQAIDVDDFNTAQSVDLMIQEAEQQLSSMGKPGSAEIRKQLDSSIEPAGLGGSIFAGLNQGFTEDVPAGIRGILPLASGDTEARAAIAAEQLPVEQRFQSLTREHPFAANMARSAPLFAMSGGKTGPGALLRGAAGGAMMFNPDPEMQAMQMMMGGGANMLGRKLPGLLNKDVARTQQQGMRMTPESRVASPLDTFVSGLRTTKNQGQKVARFNQQAITKEALNRLGAKGDKFADDTLGMVDEDTGKMFDKAVSGNRNIFVGGIGVTKLRNMLDPDLKVLRPKGEGKVLLTDFLDDIQSNGGILSVKNYQEIRSKFTKMMLKTTDADRKLAMGQVIELLDNSAARSLHSQPEKLKILQQARKRWRDFMLISNPGVVADNGMISTGKLRSLLNRKDRGGFMLNRDTSKLSEMLRLDRRGPQVGTPSDPFTFTHMLTYPIERSIVGANRLPTRAVEGAPLAATIPLLRPPVQGRGDESDELVIRR